MTEGSFSQVESTNTEIIPVFVRITLDKFPIKHYTRKQISPHPSNIVSLHGGRTTAFLMLGQMRTHRWYVLVVNVFKWSMNQTMPEEMSSMRRHPFIYVGRGGSYGLLNIIKKYILTFLSFLFTLQSLHCPLNLHLCLTLPCLRNNRSNAVYRSINRWQEQRLGH
jgi:hypothetical protein